MNKEKIREHVIEIVLVPIRKSRVFVYIIVFLSTIGLFRFIEILIMILQDI
jgi:hypothetical protein